MARSRYSSPDESPVPTSPPTTAGAPLALVSDDPERSWLVRIRAGDVAAFEALYRAYVIPLYTFVLGYTGDRAVAEELVQDVLCGVWEQHATWQVRDTVRSYLYAAARNRALNHLRHARVVRRWESEMQGAGGPGADTAARHSGADLDVEAHELRDAVTRAIALLPERCRAAYTLRFQGGLTVAQIASVMQITPKGAEMALMRATKALRLALEPYLGPP